MADETDTVDSSQIAEEYAKVAERMARDSACMCLNDTAAVHALLSIAARIEDTNKILRQRLPHA